MTIAVTGAAGGLGSAAVAALLSRGVAAGSLVATSRDPEKLRYLTERGVDVRRADYAVAASLREAFTGVDRLLLVSSNSRGDRVAEHRAAIEAAREAGVSHIAYTSLLHADTAQMISVRSHRETEQVLEESGVGFTILRNGSYFENYLIQMPFVREAKALYGGAGKSPISAAARADYAEAAAAVLTTSGHDGRIYELGGDTPLTLPEVAQELAQLWDEPISYIDLPEPEELTAALSRAGVPQFFAPVAVDTGSGAIRGELFTDTGQLSALIGRPTVSFRDALHAAS
jgi:NAD(P)H dehydrogenase (quinone)